MFSHGDDQSPARLELIDQRLWDVVGGGGHNDQIKGAFVGPTTIAIAVSDGDVVVSQILQTLACGERKRFDDLDTVDLLHSNESTAAW